MESAEPENTPVPTDKPDEEAVLEPESEPSPEPTPEAATPETAEDLSPEDIAAKVQEEYGYSDEIMAHMTSDEIAALAFKMGIEVDREFYEYFDARTPMLMDAIDEDASTIYNFIAWDGRVCVGANDIRYMAPGEYVISVIGLTSGLVKSISFTLPDNGQGEIVGGNPDGSLTTAQMRAMAASAVQLPTGVLTGNSTIARCVAGDPVDMITGGLDWSYTDLSLEGDKQMAFVRSYNSRQGESNAAGLGNGWSHNYNYKMDIFHGEISVNLPGGGYMEFTKQDGNWLTDASNLWKLTESGDGYLLSDEQGKYIEFDAAGHGVRVTEADGTVTTLTYDGDHLATVSTETGTFTFGYEGDLISSITDSAGRTVTYGHSGTDLTSSVNPDGDSLNYTYNEKHWLTTVTDFNGNMVLENTYNENGKVILQKMPDRADYSFTYDPENLTNTMTASDGKTLVVTYNDDFVITSQTDSAGTISYGYDEKSRKISETDRNGNTTQYTYVGDTANVSTVTYPNGTVETYTYNDNYQVPI